MSKNAEVIAYTITGAMRTSAQHVLESRTRLATFDDDFPVWVCRKKNYNAARRPLSDWDYEELWIVGNVRKESEAVQWVVEGVVR